MEKIAPCDLCKHGKKHIQVFRLHLTDKRTGKSYNLSH